MKSSNPFDAPLGVGLMATGAFAILIALAAPITASHIKPVSTTADRTFFEGWRGLLLGEQLDLASASYLDILSLPTVGPSTASSLMENRDMLVKDLDRLPEVPGIGKVKYQKLRGWFHSSR